MRAACMAGMSVSAFLLSAAHDRRSFHCGVEALDDFLRRLARQHAAAHVSRTYVAAVGATVRGFYSLGMSEIRRDDMPAEHATRFPNFPLPVARRARLSVDQPHHGQRLGELLLADALQRCLRLSLDIGMVGVIVDARDEQALGWYERYEFERLRDSPLTLWWPTAAIERL